MFITTSICFLCVVAGAGFEVARTIPDNVNRLPVLATVLVFVIWCTDVRSANNQGTEIALAAALLGSFVVYLVFAFAYLIHNPDGFRRWFTLSWLASVPIALALLLQSNPLSWDGIAWRVFVPQAVVSTLPCLASHLISKGHAGAVYAVPATMASYVLIMLGTW